MTDAPRMKGGFTVAGMVTGSFLVEDIKISVPHQVAVYIPADQAYKSKDLWRGINQGRLFLLTGGSGLAVEPNTDMPTTVVAADLTEAQADNKKLRQKLGETQQQKMALEESLQSMQGQLTSILRALGRIESGGNGGIAVRGLPQAVAAVAAAVETNQAVGGDVPSFIPDGFVSDDAQSNITVEATVVEGSSVQDAAKLLRQARRAAKT